MQRIRNARSKTQAHSINGMMLHCVGCKELFSTTEIVNMALMSHCEISSSTVTFSLAKEGMDLAAYRYIYDYNGMIPSNTKTTQD